MPPAKKIRSAALKTYWTRWSVQMMKQHECFCLVFLWIISCSPSVIPHLPGLSWGHSALRRHGVINSFLSDCLPTTNYRDTELQDVFNVHLTSFNWVAELTHKKGDFFPLVIKLLAHVHGGHTKPNELIGKNLWRMRWTTTLHSSLAHAGTKTELKPGPYCFNK